MKLETVFEKFDQFAGAPDAVAKMRELVLGLAIRGKLVEQNEREGTGADLLDQVMAKRRDAKPIRPSGENLELTGLPSNWAQTRLGDVTNIIRGVTFPGSAKSSVKTERDVACLRTANVQAEIDWDDLIFVSHSYVKRPDQWVAKNDVMISMANSYALVGKVAVVRCVPQRATFGAFLGAIRPILLEPYYLLYVLRSPWMQSAFRASSSQTTNIANISLGGMRPLPFPLPPLAEQKRIVAKVDELMALCDRLEAQQQERDTRHAALARASLARLADEPTPANLQFLFHRSYDIAPADLRKSILTLAVQGKLVPQDTNDEPAEHLLTRVAELKDKAIREGAVRPQKQLPAIACDAAESTLPPSWAVERLGNLAFRIGSGSTPRGGKNAYVSHGIPFLRSQNIWNDGIRLSDAVFIPNETHEQMANTKVQPNDILLNITGASLGRTAVAPPDFPEANVSQHVTIIRPVEPESRRFIHFFLLSPQGQQLIWTRQVGMAREGLSKKVLELFEVPFPPLAEQRRIVAKVEQLMALVDELETQLAESRATAKNLLEALVAELTTAGAPSPTVPA